MQTLMENHVEEHKMKMFKDAALLLENSLADMIHFLVEKMSATTVQLPLDIEKLYMDIIAGVDILQASKAAQDSLHGLLAIADAKFARVMVIKKESESSQASTDSQSSSPAALQTGSSWHGQLSCQGVD